MTSKALDEAKGARARNFSNHETEVLIKYVKKYKGIIECKKTDAVSSNSKEKAWNKITDESIRKAMNISGTK